MFIQVSAISRLHYCNTLKLELPFKTVKNLSNYNVRLPSEQTRPPEYITRGIHTHLTANSLPCVIQCESP